MNLINSSNLSTSLASSTTFKQTARKLSTNAATQILMKPKNVSGIQPQLVPQQSLSSSGTDGSKTDLINLKPKNDTVYIQSGEQSNAPLSHQVTSMNESKAKQVCKKRPFEVIR